MVGASGPVGGFSAISFRSPPPAASPGAPAASSPSSAGPSQNPSILALQGESGFDGPAAGGQVGTPAMGGSIEAIFQRKVNAIMTGDIFGLLF